MSFYQENESIDGEYSPIPTIGSKDPTTNLQNPYNLHHRKNPCSILVASPLEDHNYHNWSCSINHALTSMTKLYLIYGTLPNPTTNNHGFKLWDRENVMVISWINETLSPYISQSTICFDSALELWDDIPERFTKDSNFWLSDLLRHFHFINKGDIPLIQYFTKL